MLISQFTRRIIASAIVIVAGGGFVNTANAGAVGQQTSLTAPPPVKATPRNRPSSARQSSRRLAPTQAPPQRWLGPANAYFERGTGTGVINQQRNHGAAALPPIRRHDGRFNRHANGQPGRAATAARPGGLSAGQVRHLQTQLPRRQQSHVVDPRSQWSARDSAGIRFGLPAARVPQRLSTADEAGVVLHGRINDRDTSDYSRNGSHNGSHVGLIPGALVRRVPHGHLRAHHRGQPYWYADSVWYRPWNGRFRVVVPPIGLVISSLPFEFNVVVRNGLDYYAANNVFLRRIGSGYVVVGEPLRAGLSAASHR